MSCSKSSNGIKAHCENPSLCFWCGKRCHTDYPEDYLHTITESPVFGALQIWIPEYTDERYYNTPWEHSNRKFYNINGHNYKAVRERHVIDLSTKEVASLEYTEDHPAVIEKKSVGYSYSRKYGTGYGSMEIPIVTKQAWTEVCNRGQTENRYSRINEYEAYIIGMPCGCYKCYSICRGDKRNCLKCGVNHCDGIRLGTTSEIYQTYGYDYDMSFCKECLCISCVTKSIMPTAAHASNIKRVVVESEAYKALAASTWHGPNEAILSDAITLHISKKLTCPRCLKTGCTMFGNCSCTECNTSVISPELDRCYICSHRHHNEATYCKIQGTCAKCACIYCAIRRHPSVQVYTWCIFPDHEETSKHQCAKVILSEYPNVAQITDDDTRRAIVKRIYDACREGEPEESGCCVSKPTYQYVS